MIYSWSLLAPNKMIMHLKTLSIYYLLALSCPPVPKMNAGKETLFSDISQSFDKIQI